MDFYPKRVNERFSNPRNAGKIEQANAVGTGATFVCGSFVRVFLEIDVQTKEIRNAKFKSNGCGFAIAAADVLTEKIIGYKLTALHGLEDFTAEIERELGKFDENRRHCLEICLDGFQQALANFRASLIEEFTGEKALICTCFGISEETIERVIDEHHAATVEEVGAICNAGTGCGSCQFLIAEMLDAKDDIFNS